MREGGAPPGEGRREGVRLQALRSFEVCSGFLAAVIGDVEAHALALGQRPEPGFIDRGNVHEYVA